MNKNEISFKGKVALVTGGTRGIGRKIVELLAELGAQVIYTGTNRIGDFRQKNITYFPLDLSDEESLITLLQHVQSLPKLDILINNAGINKIDSIDHIKKEDWDRILEVNLTGAMHLMQSAVIKMKKKKTAGRILNISSIFGVVSRPRRNSYSASKFGLIGLTKASALDLAPYNILVNALCPGFTLTDLTKTILSKDEIKKLSKTVPLGRFANEEEIAKSAVFMCSDWNSFMTGQVLVADGGFISK